MAEGDVLFPGVTRSDWDDAQNQLAAHHEGLTSCDVCGWVSEEAPDG